jgi:uncharacterized protein with PQ loop repeat
LFEVIGQGFGFAGGIIGIATGLPQYLRIRKQGNHDGLALSPWILMLATFSAFTAYGLIAHSASIWVCNLLTFFTTALVVTAVKGNGIKVWASIIAGGIACATLIILLPPAITSIVLVLLTANRVPQLIRTWMNRRKDMVTAVSISSLMVAFSSMACWEVYALLTGDHLVVLTTAVAIAITLSTALMEAHIARLAKQARLA